jgi:uroporphyrinogen decarboxylase
MRQAGRYLPEYRKIREKASLLEICRDPALCTEVTLQPVERLGVDAAILFADILLPLEPMGAPFHFAQGEGPVIEKPVRSGADVDRMRALEHAEGLEYVMEDIRTIRGALAGKVPLIGFAGAPFTLASYLIQGGGSRDFSLAKTFMFAEERAWNRLLEKLSTTILSYLRAQVAAGAEALQLFDSWVGCLSPQDYVRYVKPHSKRILDGCKDLGVPVIHFGVDTATLLTEIRDAGGDVIGVDWKTPLDDARRLLGRVPVQGNLDPVLLLGAPELAIERTRDVLRRAGKAPGHVFNVGHGLLPPTDPGLVAEVVRVVHAETAR